MTRLDSSSSCRRGERRGARDFVQKPWETLAACHSKRKSICAALRQASRSKPKTASCAPSPRHILAKSPAMLVLELSVRLDRRTRTFDYRGAGHWKRFVARTLHAFVQRATKPWLTVNAGGLSEVVFRKRLLPCQRCLPRCAPYRVGRFELADAAAVPGAIANVPLILQAKSCAFLRRRSRARWLVHHPRAMCECARHDECRRECRCRRRRFRQTVSFG